MEPGPFATLEEFWPYYVAQHLNPTTRALHFAGTTAGLFCLGASFVRNGPWWIPAGLAVSYGLAWIGHFFFEKNAPATFKYPLFSLRADLRMYGLMWRGKMGAELQRLKPAVAAYRRAR